MTPKEKAKDLVADFTDTIFESGNTVSKPMVKSCALILADACYKEAYKQGNEIALIRSQYWQSVKTEIERL